MAAPKQLPQAGPRRNFNRPNNSAALAAAREALSTSQTSPIGNALLLPTDRVLPPQQGRAVRRHIDEKAHRELTQNILAAHEAGQGIEGSGIYEPILVKAEGRSWRVIAGARRLRAAQEAALPHIPAIVRDVSEVVAWEIGLVENLLRHDMTSVDVAAALQQWMRDANLSLREVARRTGKSHTDLSRAIGVVNDEVLRRAVEQGDITPSQARELINVEPAHKPGVVAAIAQRRRAGRPTSLQAVREAAKSPDPSGALRTTSRAHRPEQSGALRTTSATSATSARNTRGPEPAPEAEAGATEAAVCLLADEIKRLCQEKPEHYQQGVRELLGQLTREVEAWA